MSETTPALPDHFADAPRAKGHGGLIHTCNGDIRSGLPFGRKAPKTCARCWEMVEAAAPARQDFAAVRRNPAAEDARRAAEIRAHFASARHTSGGCGIVCTFGDW